ncbi:MAG: hypothetical protein KDB75_11895, partial [Flavobacteriales bacterium]|nr:hypothetical protein [Flavobacteriales bacterium]
SKNSGAMKLLQVEEMAHLLGEATTYIEETLGRKHRTSHYYLDLATRINDLRETEMIRFALQRWKLEGEQLDRFVEVDSKAQEKENQVFIMKPEVKEPITEEVPSDQ